jgi:hypothetical protein
MSLSTPFIAIFTGRYLGYPVTRNPFSWIGMFAWGLLLIPFTIVVSPFFILLTALGFHRLAKHGKTAVIKKDTVEVSSRREGLIDRLSVEEIEKVETRFEPPVVYPVLILNNGRRIELKAAETRSLIDEFKVLGIGVDEKPRMGSEGPASD